MRFKNIINNKYIFQRVVHFIHEGHHLYACKYRNNEIDDALWLVQTGSFEILRNKILLDGVSTDDLCYRLLYWPVESLSILFEKQRFDIIELLLANRSVGSLQYCFFTTDVIDKAVASSAPISLLERINSLLPRSITWRCYSSAAQAGRLDVIEWLRKSRADILPTGEATVNAAANGHLHLIKYFHENDGWATFSKKVLDAGIKSGNRQLIDFILDKRPEGLSNESIDLLAANSELHDMIFTLVRNKSVDAQCTYKSLVHACRFGNLKLLKFLMENEKKLTSVSQVPFTKKDIDCIGRTESSLSTAIRYCNVNCFDYLSKLPVYKSYIGIVTTQLHNNLLVSDQISPDKHMELFQYLKLGKYTFDIESINIAVILGDIKLFDLAMTQFGNCLTYASIVKLFQNAVGYVHLEMTLELYIRYVINNTGAVGQGIAFGLKMRRLNPTPPADLIEILERLHHFPNHPLRLAPSQVYEAARTSEEMLRYLFTFYSSDSDVSKYSSSYLDTAAGFGCLDIVEHCSKGIHSDELKKCYYTAAARGQLHILQYLTSEHNIKGDQKSLVEAIKQGHLKAVEYIHRTGINTQVDTSMLNTDKIQMSHHLASLMEIQNSRNTFSKKLYGSDDDDDYVQSSQFQKTQRISAIKNLSQLKLFFSKWYLESTSCKISIDLNTIHSLITTNKIDLLVFLLEEVKYNHFDKNIFGRAGDNINASLFGSIYGEWFGGADAAVQDLLLNDVCNVDFNVWIQYDDTE
ncbi:hypothetical protein PPL_02315 [Heterostelium album PN500]|uniref:Ankyrin repeat-containing protein n=1 Tax=Heterostelium pallidum (strain ATCC 26659 / Pp 5 / PN500) TaxID=670386 RepID=D3B1Z0_HETP5|nr:hypothetical protein PPL_02315 [Heterostelium album PN500]EFA85314.1 hypothetical protein PPL_02315 [Heterostelium album PN500]|eukprot:XP_020437423.1 hypothetical protein PPL_02315 [Heterostelium album PN500]